MRIYFKFILFILFVICHYFTFAQNKTDSLEILFKYYTDKNIRTENTINVLKELYEEYKISSPDLAIEYATIALDISVEINDTTQTAYINRLIGDVYFNQKIYYLAMKSYYEALKIFDRINNDNEYALSLIDIAYTHYIEEISDEFAINYYLEAINIFEKIDNQIGLAKAYSMIALVYSRKKEYDKALDYLVKSLIISQRQNNKQLEAQSYFDIALIYKNQQKYSDAIGYLENSYLIYSNENLNTAKIFSEKAEIYNLLNENEKAIENLNYALKQYEFENDNINIADIYNSLAEVYFNQQDFSNAIYYAQKAMKISNDNYFLSPQEDAYFILSKVYAEIGEFDLAFRSFNYYSQIKDSLLSQKSADRYTDLQVSIKTLLNEKEKQILKSDKEIQELKNKKQKSVIYFFIVVILFLLILSVILYTLFRYKRKSEERLTQLAEASIEGIAFHDKGLILEANKKFLELIGYSRDEIFGKNIIELIAQDDRKKIQDNIYNFESTFYQITYLKKDGSDFLADVSSRPFTYKNKNIKVVSIRDISMQKIAEKKLTETEMKFTTLVETSPDGVVIINEQLNIDYASKTFYQLFEIEIISNVIGTKITDYIAEDYKAKIKVDINNMFLQKYGGISEYCALKPDKSIFFIECNGELLKNAENKIVGVFLIIRDITERKLTENALIESETRFKGLFDNAKDGIIIHDKNFKIIDVNPFVSQILEFSYQELLDFDFTTIVLDDFKQDLNIDKIVIEEKTIELEIFTKNKKQTFIQLSLSKLSFTNQELFLSIIRDITTQKQSEYQLKKSEEKYRTLAELLPATVCEIDLNGNFIFLNKNSYEMFGYLPNNKLINVFNHTIAQDHERIKMDMAKALQTDVNEGVEYTAIKADGTLFPIMIYSSVLKSNNQPVGFRAIVTDISARKKYEEELKYIAENLKISNATKDKMFSIIAHDLRGPIGNLKAMMELLLENPEEFEIEEITDILSSLKDSSVSTYDLLENLLNWAKSQQGLVEYIPDIHDIRSIIISSVLSQKPNSVNKKIKILNTVVDGIKVICDVNMIKTVLRNLISNAIKFTNENGLVEIAHQFDNENVIISVKDNGIGIEAKNLPKIFDENEYFTTYGTNREKGSGLGLKLCKEFIEKNHGKIWVESIFGEGATFYFSLKLY